MSEYADITIKKLSLFSFRNYVDEYIVSLLFSRDDLLITPNSKIDIEDEDAGEYTKFVYRTTVKKARDRLDALGFGIYAENLIRQMQKHLN